MPEIQGISDAWLDKLDAFIRAGGGVIASGKPARYNEWMRGRDPEHALARWLGHAPRKAYECVTVGKGRFVYVPDAVLVEGIVPAGGRDEGLDLHFINYDAANTVPVMVVRVGLPAGKNGAVVECVRCDEEGHPREKTPVTIAAGEAVFRMFTPKVYGRGQGGAWRVAESPNLLPAFLFEFPEP